MSHKHWLGTGVAAFLVGSTFIVAHAAKSPSASATTRPAKLTKPWSEIKDLSDEQVTKIKTIHEKFLEEQHVLESKQKADIMALLTDAQKKELDEALAEDKKEAAERRVAKDGKTEKTSATTKPSSGK